MSILLKEVIIYTLLTLGAIGGVWFSFIFENSHLASQIGLALLFAGLGAGLAFSIIVLAHYFYLLFTSQLNNRD